MIKFFTDLFKGYRVMPRFTIGKTYYVPQIRVLWSWYNVIIETIELENGNSISIYYPVVDKSEWFETEHEAYEAIKKVLGTKK